MLVDTVLAGFCKPQLTCLLFTIDSRHEQVQYSGLDNLCVELNVWFALYFEPLCWIQLKNKFIVRYPKFCSSNVT